MTPIEQRREWLALLEEELARRAARTKWEAGAAERAREEFITRLQEMAERLAVPMPLHPLEIDDMSIAEKLACRLFLQPALRPAGLPTEDQIWAEYEARKQGT